MSSGRGGGVISPARAACGEEAVKAMVMMPANTMPATLKLPIVLNNFDFKFLYNISILLLFALLGGCGAGTHIAFSDRPQRLIRCELIADHLTTRRPFH